MYFTSIICIKQDEKKFVEEELELFLLKFKHLKLLETNRSCRKRIHDEASLFLES